MTPPRPEQPATAAGRALLELLTLSQAGAYLADILAIEREAAAPLSVAELADAAERIMHNVGLAPTYAPMHEFHDYTEAMGFQVNWERVAAAILAEIERGRG